MSDSMHHTRMERLETSVGSKDCCGPGRKCLIKGIAGRTRYLAAALDMAIRCLGHGTKVLAVQFIKGVIDTAGETQILQGEYRGSHLISRSKADLSSLKNVSNRLQDRLGEC